MNCYILNLVNELFLKLFDVNLSNSFEYCRSFMNRRNVFLLMKTIVVM